MKRNDCLEEYVLVVRNEGIISLLGKRLVSAAHDDGDVAATVAAYERVIGMMG